MMNTIVLSCLAFVAVSAQMPYNTTVGLKKDVLLDKIKGGWAGQTIGCTYGGPTEFKYKGGLIPDKEPIVWYDDYCKDIFDEDPGLYDDVYMDLTFLEVMQHKGINAPPRNMPIHLHTQDTSSGMPIRLPDIIFCMVSCHRSRGIGKTTHMLMISISR